MARTYKNYLHKLRAFLLITKAVAEHTSAKGREKKPLQMISKQTDLLTSFATFDAAKAVSQGEDFDLPPCMMGARADADFDFPIHSTDPKEIEKPFCALAANLEKCLTAVDLGNAICDKVTNTCIALLQLALSEEWETTKLHKQISAIIEWAMHNHRFLQQMLKDHP